MTRTKSIIGALVLCALSIGAFAAASASASELTAVTCVAAGAEGTLNSHCETGTSGEFKTTALALNTKTEVEGKNAAGTEPTLRACIGGSCFTVICENSVLEGGSVTNKEPTAGKHTIESTATSNKYTKCHAALQSKETRFCSVKGITGGAVVDQIKTTELKGTTTGVAHQVKLEPKTGTVFTEFEILKKGENPPTEFECWLSAAGANLTVKVEGSIEGEADTTKHSHLTFTEANNGNNLKVGGGVAKYLDTVVGNMKGQATTTVGATTFT